MTPYAEVQLAATGLRAGDSIKIRCPWCWGGASKEISMSVTRTTTGILYHCFRASCDRFSRGSLGGGMRSSWAPIKKSPTVREFDWETYAPTDETLQHLWDRYRIDEAMARDHRLLQSSGGDIVVPLLARSGTRNGVIVRLRNPRGRIKVLSYPGHESNGIAWFLHEPGMIGTNLILVEDVFSAIRASQYMDAVALTGTSLNIEQACDIAAAGHGRIYLALDQDAAGVAVRMATRYRGTLPNMRVVRLEGPDIKDMTDAEADEFFHEQLSGVRHD